MKPETVGSRPVAALVLGAALVAATYIYFLIFAEFAFLELVRDVAGPWLRAVMALLGGGGVAGAWAAARAFRTARAALLLARGLQACAGAAMLAPFAGGPLAAGAIAAAVGLALGWTTVVLAAALRNLVGGRRLGLCVGAGTGTAYAACNVPVLFGAGPATQALLAAGLALGASLLPWPPAAPVNERPETLPPHGERVLVLAWLAMFLALVWMDSAAFYIIQHTSGLRAVTWGTPGLLWTNAAVHLGAALLAGAVLDRGGRRAVIAGATALLGLGTLALGDIVRLPLPAGWWYTAGVSLYSVALVEYPARTGGAGRAALVFAVAGWIGSALGIGMAQDLHRVPATFVFATVAVILLALGRARGVAAVVAGLIMFVPPGRAAGEEDAVRRGREVYIAEGCIHCHSQYLRPRVAADVERWGPVEARATSAGDPPLPGNRRQGPDLSRVGNRRSPEWNRLHLIAPRAFLAGSRMPSYAHLFAAGDQRGEDLVAYLASLGADTTLERARVAAAWQPADVAPIGPDESRRLFVLRCAPCHGPVGGGDGPLAARLMAPPAAWRGTDWRHVPPGPEAEVALARIIKFGLPGLPMAGHEVLGDAALRGLARHAETLRQAPDLASLPAAPR
jgi:cytochrome c oxidase cbb3-type subunit 2